MAQRYDNQRDRNDRGFGGYRAEDDRGRGGQRFGGPRDDDSDRFQDRFYNEAGQEGPGSMERGLEDWQQHEGGNRGGPQGYRAPRGQDWGGRDHVGSGGRDYGGNGGGRDFVAAWDQGGRGDSRRDYGSGGHDGRDRELRGYGAPDWIRGDEGRERGSRDRGESHSDRGFMERASDEVASWMGSEEATRRREEDHRGKGPRGYQRSDERIQDDVNDRLSDDPRLDASDINVSVASAEVTLSGEVTSKFARRQAEDCADAVSGVRYVQNNLRVRGSQTPGSAGGTGVRRDEIASSLEETGLSGSKNTQA